MCLRIKNVFDDGELERPATATYYATVQTEGEFERDSVVANFAITASDGKTYQVDYYNLDIIFSVGYRVN